MQAPPLDGAAGKVQSGKPPPPPHGKKPLMEPIQPVADYVTGIGARHLGRGYSPLAAAAKQRTATSQPWSSAVAGWRWWLRVLRSPVPAREGRAALAQHTRQGPRAPAGRPAATMHRLRQSGGISEEPRAELKALAQDTPHPHSLWHFHTQKTRAFKLKHAFFLKCIF